MLIPSFCPDYLQFQPKRYETQSLQNFCLINQTDRFNFSGKELKTRQRKAYQIILINLVRNLSSVLPQVFCFYFVANNTRKYRSYFPDSSYREDICHDGLGIR